MNELRTASPDASVDGTQTSYRQTVRRLARAQKSAKGGQAYSQFVNRRLGRLAAAAAYHAGLTPNAVTVTSATCSAAGIAVIALVSGLPAVVAAPLLAIGYLLDAADGQLARLRGGGSISGEWLDHSVDSVKITSLHLAVLIHLYRFTDLGAAWYLVPLGFTVVAVALFFAQLLNEQLRRSRGIIRTASDPVSSFSLFAKLPHDYGILCWTFVLLPATSAFIAVYTFLLAFNAAYLSLALLKWWREMRTLDALPPR
jgi:phosphatidylglycerophosphate synthase